MTHKRFRILWPILIICILLLASYALHQRQTIPNPATANPERPSIQESQVLLPEPVDRVTVYFYTTDQQNLVPLSFSVNSTRAAADVAIEKLLAGPPNKTVHAVINDGAKLQNLYQEDGIIYVDLTAIDKTADPALLVKAVNATLGSLLPQEAVQILLDGAPLPAPYDEPQTARPVNYYGKEDALANNDLLTVFYGDATSDYLVPVTLPLLKGTPEDAVLKALQGSAPKNSNLRTLTYTDCPITFIKSDQGKVVLSFSSAILGRQSNAAEEKQMLEAIVATFSQFSDVTAVQFLVEEKIVDHLPGGNEIDIPFPVEKMPVTNIL